MKRIIRLSLLVVCSFMMVACSSELKEETAGFSPEFAEGAKVFNSGLQEHLINEGESYDKMISSDIDALTLEEKQDIVRSAFDYNEFLNSIDLHPQNIKEEEIKDDFEEFKKDRIKANLALVEYVKSGDKVDYYELEDYSHFASEHLEELIENISVTNN